MNDEGKTMFTSVELEQLADWVAEKVADKIAGRKHLVDRHAMAKLLGVSMATFDRQLRDVGLPRVRIGRRIQFDPADVIAYMKE